VICLFSLFVSGGNKLEVRGLNLASTQKPQFIVYINSENRTGVWLLIICVDVMTFTACVRYC